MSYGNLGQESIPGSRNEDLEKNLELLPDQVSDALLAWRTATLNREKTEALLYLRFRADTQGIKRTSDEIKSMVRSDDGRYKAVLDEVMAESNYVRLNERLLSFKKLSALRTAF